MTIWKDISSYSHREEHIPNWWATPIGEWMLSVGNKHVNHKDDPHWVMHFAHHNAKPLGRVVGMTEEEAKNEALRIVREMLYEAIVYAGGSV